MPRIRSGYKNMTLSGWPMVKVAARQTRRNAGIVWLRRGYQTRLANFLPRGNQQELWSEP
jgi:hypothetical protein